MSESRQRLAQNSTLSARRASPHPWASLCLALLAATFLADAASAQRVGCPPSLSSGRARPVFENGTLVSDQHTPLRGLQWHTDSGTPTLPTQAALANARNAGLNALHLYAERESTGNKIGYNACLVDRIVNATADNDLYLVLTLGDGTQQYAIDFWSYYAPRYKDLTHVVFEVKNESWAQAPPMDAASRTLNKLAYQAIRAVAPNRPVLVASYALFENPTGVAADLSWLTSQASVDWTKTGVAFHGYAGAAATAATIREIKSLGYPVMETEGACPASELPPNGSCDREAGLYFPLVDVWESTHTSWLANMNLTSLGAATFNLPLQDQDVVWAADEGDFPATSEPPADGQEIALRSTYNNRYVRVNPTNKEVRSQTTTLGTENRFAVARSGRLVALRSLATNQYLRPVATSANRLFADSATPYYFEWVTLPSSMVALQSTTPWSWSFVRTDFGSADDVPPLAATSVQGGGDWEGFHFELLDAGAPTIQITSPTSFEVLRSLEVVDVSVQTSAAPGTTVTRVEFHVGDLSGTDSVAPFAYSFPPQFAPHNSFGAITAVALASNGTTASTTLFVQFDAHVDAVAMTSPASGATVAGSVPLSAIASDSNGIQQITFQVDGVDVYTDTQAPFTYPWNSSSVADGVHAFRAIAMDIPGNLRPSASHLVTVDNTPAPACVASATTLCLWDDRFEVTLGFEDHINPQAPPGVGQVLPLTDETGLFYFFHPTNIEVMVKILDGRAINGNWWIYHGGATDLEYTLSIRDTSLPTSPTNPRIYTKPVNSLCGGRDFDLFDGLGGAPEQLQQPGRQQLIQLPAGPENLLPSCNPNDPATLCLQGNRFAITVDWTDYQGVSGQGTRVPYNDGTGFFWFFSTANTELGIKVLDGRALNGHWWIFFTALSDVEYHVTVTDTVTGATWDHHNDLGHYCGGSDNQAFED